MFPRTGARQVRTVIRSRTAWVGALAATLILTPLAAAVPWVFVPQGRLPSWAYVAWVLAVVALTAEFLRRRLGMRLVRTPTGILVVGMRNRREIPWSDVHHATVEIRDRRTKGGTVWQVTPALVLRHEPDPVPLTPVVFWTSAIDYRQAWVRRDYGHALTTLDSWLAEAAVPVDSAYAATHAWNDGTMGLGEVRSVLATQTGALRPVSDLDELAAALVASPVVTEQQRRYRPHAGHRLMVVGWVLMALVGALTALLSGFVVADLATGTTVPVHLVATQPDNQCVIVADADPGQTWTTQCIGDWTSDLEFTVRIGGLSDDPVRGVDVLGIVLVGLVLAGLAAFPLFAGMAVRGPRRLRSPPVQPPSLAR
jgi:hypothetical protein